MDDGRPVECFRNTVEFKHVCVERISSRLEDLGTGPSNVPKHVRRAFGGQRSDAGRLSWGPNYRTALDGNRFGPPSAAREVDFCPDLTVSCPPASSGRNEIQRPSALTGLSPSHQSIYLLGIHFKPLILRGRADQHFASVRLTSEFDGIMWTNKSLVCRGTLVAKMYPLPQAEMPMSSWHSWAVPINVLFFET